MRIFLSQTDLLLFRCPLKFIVPSFCVFNFALQIVFNQIISGHVDFVKEKQEFAWKESPIPRGGIWPSFLCLLVPMWPLVYLSIYLSIYYPEKIPFHFRLRYYIWDKKFQKWSSLHSNRIRKERKIGKQMWPNMTHYNQSTTTFDRYYHLQTILTPPITGITTYWPYHPQSSRVLPPNDQTTPMVTCITT